MGSIIKSIIVIGLLAGFAVICHQQSNESAGGGTSSCDERNAKARDDFTFAKGRMERLAPTTMKATTDAIGEALDCDDETCIQGPCARCYWIYQGCDLVGRIYVTVEKWGTPLDVRNGSRVLAVEYLDR